jgi:hypothetical protein
MKSALRTIAAFLPAVIILTAAVSAQGQAIPPTMSVTPTKATIAPDGSTTVPLVWSTNFTAMGVKSSQGRFKDPAGGTLATNNTSFLSPADCINGCTFNESLQVPGSVIADAGKRGYQKIRYVRTWNFFMGPTPGPTIKVTVELDISGAPRQVTVTPSRAIAGFGLDTNLRLRWRVLLSPTDGSVLVRSEEGVFMDRRDRPLGPAVKVPLSKRDPDRVTFEENLTVPSEVVAKAVSRNLKGFRYVRFFTVGSAQLMGELELSLGSGVDSVSVSPSRIRASTGRDTFSRVTWTVGARPDAQGAKSLRSKAVPAGGLDVVSGEGVFHTYDGQVLGTGRSDLRLTLTGPSASVVENVKTTGEIVRKALQRGQNRFLYTRTFSDGYGTASGDLIIDVSGRIGGQFAVDRVSLAFSDGSLVKVLNPDEVEHAVATLTFTGTGIFVARWEIARPTSTAGRLTFVNKRNITMNLSGASGMLSRGGGRRVELTSPALETDMSGQYAIRLVITSPDVGGETVTLLYQVNPPTVGAIPIGPGAVPEIGILLPRGRTPVTPGTPFAWEGLAGSTAYLVEFYDGPKVLMARRVSGQVVPADNSTLALSQMTMDNLAPGMNYWWRVIALGPGGGILGASMMTPVHTP